MSEVRFIISDAAKKVDVEPHVLRYWEEELNLEIGRNEMGHRYYTEVDLRVFKTVKELKEQGFQLKAIKILLPEIKKGEGLDIDSILHMREELNERVVLLSGNEDLGDKEKNKENTLVELNRTNLSNRQTNLTPPLEQGDKMQQFKNIINNIVVNALIENNALMSENLSSNVTNNVIKEMDYLLRLKEEKEEERFKRFDEVMREFQKSRLEIAATSSKERKEIRKREKMEKKKKIFSKKEKEKEVLEEI